MDNLDNKLHYKTTKELEMYYQTTIRNVALTTAVSFAALAYSRFYREKSALYSSGLVFVSILIVINSSILNVYLYNSMVNHTNSKNLQSSKKWLIINKIFMVVHIMLLFFGIYTLYRLITNNKFK